jgi:hypothetical protein
MRPFPSVRPGLSLVSIIFIFTTVAGLVVPPPAHARPPDAAPLIIEPARRPDPGAATVRLAAARADTIDFGYYETREDGLKYAVLGETWTWDHGGADPLEGWTPDDLTENDADFWRQVTETIWVAEGNPSPWPRMNASEGIALCGARKGYADSLGWFGGVGYGNFWCQRLTSPAFEYDGTDAVDLSFHYFNDSEIDYDFSRVFVESGSTRTLLNEPGFTGRVGIDDLGVIAPALYTRSITNAELGGGVDSREFRIVFEFWSDSGVSDEGDSLEIRDSFYGPFGVDDVVVDGSNLDPPIARVFDFEDGLQGWTASHCPGVGSFLGSAPLSQYVLSDPCSCTLAGNVLEMHDAVNQHPDGQHERAISPIIDRAGDLGDPGYLAYNRVFAEWDQYQDLPKEDGVFFRVGWSYYPYEDPEVPGLVTWSPRVGPMGFHYTGDTPECYRWRDIGTNDLTLPPDCRQVRCIYEIYSSCNAFGVFVCSGVTNFTPLVDNFRVRMTDVPHAPVLSFAAGGRYQDGFSQSSYGTLNTTDPGNADITFNVRMDQTGLPARLGDSLVVSGPFSTAQTQWEAKLWFRLARRGPGQGTNALYNTWKTSLLAAKGIDFFTVPNPPFTWGCMDSVEVYGHAQRNQYCSQFRDGPSPGGQNLPPDPNYNWGGGGEQAEGNEIIPDLALTPGTMVQYFVTSNFTSEPTEYFYLPDTAGGNFEEFEILPSFRTADGDSRFPGFLYIDASDHASDQERIEAALWSLYAGGDGPIPEPRPWDRYDYADAFSSWKASFYRQSGGNNGASLYQLLGYRSILLDMGAAPYSGGTAARDWMGLQQWLTSVACVGNHRLQALYLSGNNIAQTIDDLYPLLLEPTLGARAVCDEYNVLGCPTGEVDNDENVCVRLESAGPSPAPPQFPMDVYGSWCPAKIPFGVLSTSGTGVGNLRYHKVGSTVTTEFAQVRNDRENTTDHYRSIISGFNLGNLTARDGDDPSAECPSDVTTTVAAIRAELETAFGWLTCRDIAADPLVWNPCNNYSPPFEICPSNATPDPAAEVMVNSLSASRPNPAGPRTVIAYSLAADGPARLDIFSADGRRVRALFQEMQKAGSHDVSWDGTDDGGGPVGAGIYWSRLQAGNWTSNRKMVVLR